MCKYCRLGIGKLFCRRGKENESAVVNKESVAFHWLSFGSLLLAELWPGKKRKSFFFRLVSAIIENESSPFWTPDSISVKFPFINFQMNKDILNLLSCIFRVSSRLLEILIY